MSAPGPLSERPSPLPRGRVGTGAAELTVRPPLLGPFSGRAGAGRGGGGGGGSSLFLGSVRRLCRSGCLTGPLGSPRGHRHRHRGSPSGLAGLGGHVQRAEEPESPHGTTSPFHVELGTGSPAVLALGSGGEVVPPPPGQKPPLE